MKRTNLTVMTQTLVMSVLLEGRTAVGVRVRRAGIETELYARAEVLLCGGAINTPQTLMLSGIGSGAELQRLGIPVALDLPGVGANLQDHAIVPMTWKLKAGVGSLNERLLGSGMLRSLFEYLVLRSGALTSPAAEFTAFFKSDSALSHADVQVFGLPITGDVERAVATGADPKPEAFPGFTLAPSHVRPYSRGSVRLKGMDPAEPPAIRFNYLDDERDRRALLMAMRWLRRLAKQPALAAITEAETRPGSAIDSDAAWLDYIARSLTTGPHPTSTCRIGPVGDAMAVVTPDLRVRGIDHLRVIDASVMPSVISGNTNATSVVIGEKGADLVLGRAAPAPLAA